MYVYIPKSYILYLDTLIKIIFAWAFSLLKYF